MLFITLYLGGVHLHTVAWLKWFRQMDGWMLTPWNHLYKRTFHWAWHFSMDPVPIFWIPIQQRVDSKILLVLGVDHPNCSVAYSMVVTRVNSLYIRNLILHRLQRKTKRLMFMDIMTLRLLLSTDLFPFSASKISYSIRHWQNVDKVLHWLVLHQQIKFLARCRVYFLSGGERV